MAAAPFDPQRVALLFVPDAPAGDRNVGTGYFVDARRVLTAAHVVGTQGSRCRVLPRGRSGWLDFTVAWRGQTSDAALLVPDDDQGPEAGWAPVSFGAIAPDELERIPARAVGFPDAQVRHDAEGYELRSPEGVKGQIDAQTGDATKQLTVHLEGSVPKETGLDSTPWAGISGAALFAEGALVGVLAVDPSAFGEDRLLATSLAAVAAEPGFVAALGLPGAPTLVPVSAPSADRPTVGPPEPSVEAPLVRLPFARNPAFAGRQTLLAELEDAPAGQARALVGIGGVGKSQLAIEHAHRLVEQDRLALAWWVRADEPAFLATDLAELAEQLGLTEGETERAEAAKAALRGLRAARVPWLVIYDNAPDPDDLRDRLAGGQAGQVLITSRRRGWDGLASEVPVDVFDPETAMRFLQEASGRDDEAGARALTERLGGLALALSQAAAYVMQTGRSFADYLAKLEQGGNLLERRADSAQYRGTVAAVVAESRAAALARASEAGELLDVIAYLDPQHISLSLLEEHEDLPGFAPAALDRAVPALGAYSLIQVEEGGFGVHRLVQEITRAGHQSPAPAEEAIGLLAERFPGNAEERASWESCRRLLPHVLALSRHVLDGEPSPNREPGQSSLGRLSWLLDRAAIYLQHSGDLRGAGPHFDKALEINRRMLPDDHPDSLALRAHIAFLMRELGDHEQSLSLFSELRQDQERELGEYDANTLASRRNIADLTGERGEHKEAVRLFSELLDDYERELPDDRRSALGARHGIAFHTGEGGEPEEAVAQLEHLLLNYQRELPDEERETLEARHNIARFTAKARGHAEALRQLSELLPDFVEVLGKHHPRTLDVRHSIAYHTGAGGDPAAAVALFGELLPDYERVLGEDHPTTVAARDSMADFTNAAG